MNEETAPADTPERAGEAKEAAPAEDAASQADAAPKADAAKESAPPEETTSDKKDESGCDEPKLDEPVSPIPAATTEPAAAADAAPKSDESPSVEPKADAPKPEETNSVPAAGDETPEVIPAKDAPAGSGEKNPAAPADEKPTTPDAAPADTAPPVDPVAEAKKQYQKNLGKYETDKLGFADAVKSWEERSKAGQKSAKELSTRFGAWYYVISADSFEKLRPSRKDVVGPKEAAKPADNQKPPQFDLPGGGIPGFGVPGQ